MTPSRYQQAQRPFEQNARLLAQRHSQCRFQPATDRHGRVHVPAKGEPRVEQIRVGAALPAEQRP